MPKIDKDLFRALKNDEFPGAFHVDGIAVAGLLYPRFEAKIYVDGGGNQKESRADVEIRKNPETDEFEVQTKGGTSLFDAAGMFGIAEWKYFQIPDGTEYPEGLIIKKSKKLRSNRTKTMSAYHYQIEPKNPMTVDALKGALDTFARNAVVRSIELKK